MKKTYGILVVLGIVLVAVAVYFSIHNNTQPSSPTSVSISTAALKPGTYDNFGISFQYPSSWGIPSESFYSGNGLPQESITFPQTNASDTQPLMIFTTQDTDPMTGAVENETFDQMIARFRTNDPEIYLVKNITANGISGRELFYNNAVTGQPFAVDAYFQVGTSSYVDFGADFASVPQATFDQIISTFAYDASYAAKADAATGMSIYENNGMKFEYPQEFATEYAYLTMETTVAQEDTAKLDANGCYPGPDNDYTGGPGTTTVMTVNGIPFCYGTGGGVGAGQAYADYEYTTFRGGYAYTIDYRVQTSNGCSAYQNSPDINDPDNQKYRDCIAAGKNYSSLVLQPIEKSIGTFGFN